MKAIRLRRVIEMTGRRAIVGLCMVCALLVSAFAAQSAAAIPTGTTAFTCKAVTPNIEGTVGFSKAHCKTTDAVTTKASFEHFAVAQNTPTELEVTNANTNATTNGSTVARFHSTVAGTKFELQATGVSNMGGVLENMLDPVSGEHTIHTPKSEPAFTLTYTGVTEALLGCSVTGLPGGAGVIETKELTASSAGQGDAIKFTPPGGVFAEFEAKGPAGCPGTVKVFGSVIGRPDGATISSDPTKVTEEKTLRIGNATNGPLAGYGSTVTVLGKDKAAGDTSFTPLSVTTVATP
jgi:hypothetical protein